MVTDAPELLDATFRALAHPARRRMVAMLARAERTVGELARPFDFSLAASSKHLAVLERAGLVERTRRGRTHACRLVPARLDAAVDWSERCRAVWEANFGRLDRVLADLQAQPEEGGDAT